MNEVSPTTEYAVSDARQRRGWDVVKELQNTASRLVLSEAVVLSEGDQHKIFGSDRCPFVCSNFLTESQGSSVDVVTTLRAGMLTNGGSIPERMEGCCCPPKCTSALGGTVPCFELYLWHFLL